MNDSETQPPEDPSSQIEVSAPIVPQQSPASELKAFNQIVSAIQDFDDEAKTRIFHSVQTFLGLSRSSAVQPMTGAIAAQNLTSASPSSFSQDRSLNVKEFLFEKQPVTDIERVACLAYYLSHYREMPHFKTLDISKLNTEAAQVKFANAANAVGNAVQSGLLAPAGGEMRQISAAGERYVQELPDRVAAKEVVAGIRQRRKSKRANNQGEADSK